MRTITEIDKLINEEQKYMNDAFVLAKSHQKSMERLERERKIIIQEQEERTLNIIIESYLSSTFGIESQEEARRGKYVIFDKYCNIIKTVNCGNYDGTDFYYVSGDGDSLENWLRENKLYAHCCSSFLGRSAKWYAKTFKEQLENLTWEFDKNGKIKKTQW
jgi:hypothetical protein